MTKREKIIVGVMCLTIVYGAYELLGSRKPASKTVSKPAAQASPSGELKSFVMDVTQKLVGDNMAKEYQYMIGQADAQWSKDPFLRSTAPLRKILEERVEQVSQPQIVERTPSVTYTGFMKIGNAKLAILNGTEYEKGESLGIDKFYVKEIHPSRVVIGKLNSPDTIQLPIAEIDSGNGK